MRLARFALLVRNYDEAIRFYTESLGFTLLENTDLGAGKRWVRLAPPLPNSSDPREESACGAELLLARAATPEQEARIGNQTGGRVFLFLETDDFGCDYARLQSKGVTFIRPPTRQPYGIVAVFLDLYGNKIDLIQPISPSAE